MTRRAKTTHPSFGKITVMHPQGRGQRCFGSDLEHDHTVQITIHEASYERDLSHDWYSPGGQVVQIRMTPLQWAEFLSSQGKGEGTPCTLTYRADQGSIEAPPIYRKPHHEVFKDEAQERINRAVEATREAERLLGNLTSSAGSVKKADLKAVQEKLRQAVQEIQSNTGFVMESFEEATSRVVRDAKEEINAHFSSVIQDYGLRALAAAGAAALPSMPPTAHVLDEPGDQ